MPDAHALLTPSQRDTQQTLVVVFLRGGADGLTMVAPTGDDTYYKVRPELSVSREDSVPLDDLFGLHPRLAPLHRAYSEGDLAIVHGAGSEDQTRSHFEAQDSMEHGGLAAGGWLGRYLREAPGLTPGPLAAVSMGKAQPESLRGAPSSVAMESFDAFGLNAPEGFLDALGGLYATEENNLGIAGGEALAAMAKVNELSQAQYRPRNGATYPDNPFGQGLRHIAQLIRARVGLQAATLDLDGWDAHFGSSLLMNPLMDRLATGLSAFREDLAGDLASATVVVMTEFGRRVHENASFGTDHGRGGVLFILGGGIRGGRVIHDWKGLGEDHLEGPGDLPVAHNYRDVLAPILQRHSALTDFTRVFPDYTLNPLDLYGGMPL